MPVLGAWLLIDRWSLVPLERLVHSRAKWALSRAAAYRRLPRSHPRA